MKNKSLSLKLLFSALLLLVVSIICQGAFLFVPSFDNNSGKQSKLLLAEKSESTNLSGIPTGSFYVVEKTTNTSLVGNNSFEANYKNDNYVFEATVDDFGVYGTLYYKWSYKQTNEGEYEDLNISEKSINISSCLQSGLYMLEVDEVADFLAPDRFYFSVNILPREVKVSSFTVEDKEYDGNNNIEAVANYQIFQGEDLITTPPTEQDLAINVVAKTNNADSSQNKYVFFEETSLVGLDKDNYVLVLENEPTFVNINPCQRTINWEMPNNSNIFTYDGTNQINSIKASYTNINEQKVFLRFILTGNSIFDGGRHFINEFLNAGTYSANVVLGLDEKNYLLTDSSGDREITLLLNKKTPTITIATNTEFVYNGLSQSVRDFVSIDSNQELSFNKENFLNVAECNNVNIVVMAIENLNYKMAQTTFTVNMAKATANINTDNVRKVYEYNGFEQVINTGALINNSEQVVTYSNNTFTSVLEGNNKVVTVYALATSNYNYVSTTFQIEVNKAVINFICEWTAKNLTYNYNVQEVNLKNYPNSVTPIYENNAKKDVGTYLASVSFTLSDADNYQPVATKYYSWEIKKLYIQKPQIEYCSSTYNKQEQTMPISYNSSDIEVFNKAQTNAGKYDIIFSLKDTVNTAWADTTYLPIKATWEIKKASIKLPSVTKEYYYNGREQTLNLSESELFEVYGEKAKEIGSYKTYVALKDPNNYEWENYNNSVVCVEWKIIEQTLKQKAPFIIVGGLCFVSAIVAVCFAIKFALSNNKPTNKTTNNKGYKTKQATTKIKKVDKANKSKK